MKMCMFVLTALLVGVGSTLSHAAIVPFDLVGRSGAGLLSGNEVNADGTAATISGTPGSGGEIGAGFSFDNVARILTLNFSWTGIQGATAGTLGAATGFHIHGPVAAANPQLGTAAVLHNISAGTSAPGTTPLYTVLNNANGTGSVTGTISGITAAQEADLLAGSWYVNVHSGVNGGGEARGNLVAVPEPSSCALLGLVAAGYAARRRFAKKKQPVA